MRKLLALIVFVPLCAHAQPVPAEYDRPFTGELTIVRADRETMARRCPPRTVGCAYTPAILKTPGQCIITIADDMTLYQVKMRLEDVVRHEVAHCNGWAADHSDPKPIWIPRLIPSEQVPLPVQTINNPLPGQPSLLSPTLTYEKR